MRVWDLDSGLVHIAAAHQARVHTILRSSDGLRAVSLGTRLRIAFCGWSIFLFCQLHQSQFASLTLVSKRGPIGLLVACVQDDWCRQKLMPVCPEVLHSAGQALGKSDGTA